MTIALLPTNITVYAATSTTTDFAGGSGTEQDPYLIETAEQLSNINNYSKKYFKITTDIYLNNVDNWKNWEQTPPENIWTPIDLWNNVLDGNSKTIYGLYTSKDETWQGLFSDISGSVKDLTISESLIQGTNYCGSFAASLSGSITNCTFNGKVSVSGYCNGGLIGNVCGENAIVTNCTNNGYVENTLESDNTNDALRFGGIVGQAKEYCKILNSTNNGTISSHSSQCGGIVGFAFTHVLIDRCINYGTVNVITNNNDNDSVGGIVGGCNNSSVKNSINFGKINCQNIDRIGGIVGNGYGQNEGIYNCGNVGNITYSGNDYDRIGGIIGWTGEDYSIINVFNVGSLPETGTVGAIIGYMDSSVANIDSWYCTDDMNIIIASKYNNSNSVDTQKFSLDYFKKSEFVELFNKYITENQTKITGYYKWSDGNLDTKYFPIITNEKLPIVRKASEYKINSITISDKLGNVMNDIPTGSFLTTVSVTKTLAGGDTLIVLGQYTSNNQLVDVTYAMVEDQTIGSTVKITVPINNSERQIKEIKAFNISSFSELTPLSKTVSIYAK